LVLLWFLKRIVHPDLLRQNTSGMSPEEEEFFLTYIKKIPGKSELSID
jgi:hypothetical protein